MFKYEKWNDKWHSMSCGGCCTGCDRALTWISFKEGHCMYVYDDGTEVRNTVSHSLYGTCCNKSCLEKSKERMTKKQSGSKHLPMHELARWDWHKQWAEHNNIPWNDRKAPTKAASKEKASWLTAVVGRYFVGPRRIVRVLAADPELGSATFMVIDRMPHCLGRGTLCAGSRNSRTFSIDAIQEISHFSFMPMEDDHINDILHCLDVSEIEFKASLDEVFSRIKIEMLGEFEDVAGRPCWVRNL